MKLYYNLKIKSVSDVGTFDLEWFVAKIKKNENGTAELRKIKYSMRYSFHRMLKEGSPFGYVDAMETYEYEVLNTLVIERFDDSKELDSYLEADFKNRQTFDTFNEMYITRISNLLTHAVQNDVRERATIVTDY